MHRSLLAGTALLLIVGCQSVLAVPTPTPWASRAGPAAGGALPPSSAPPLPVDAPPLAAPPAPGAANPSVAGVAPALPSPTPPAALPGAAADRAERPAASSAGASAPAPGAGAGPAALPPSPGAAVPRSAGPAAPPGPTAPAAAAPGNATSAAPTTAGPTVAPPTAIATPVRAGASVAQPTATAPPTPAVAAPPTPVVIGAPAPSAGPPAAGASTGGLPEPGAAAPPTATTPSGVSSPDPAAHGLLFGRPAAFKTGPLTTVGVIVTSRADRINSFSLRAVYSGGGRTATAFGTLRELRPGQSRPTVLIALDAMPSPVDSVRMEVEPLSDGQVSTADAAARLALGTPTLRPTDRAHFLDVPVRNTDAAPRSATLVAALTKGDEIVAIARGEVRGIAPGASASAPLLVTWLSGSDDPLAPRAAASVPIGYDRVSVALDVTP
jgi:hypothetical protein